MRAAAAAWQAARPAAERGGSTGQLSDGVTLCIRTQPARHQTRQSHREGQATCAISVARCARGDSADVRDGAALRGSQSAAGSRPGMGILSATITAHKPTMTASTLGNEPSPLAHGPLRNQPRPAAASGRLWCCAGALGSCGVTGGRAGRPSGGQAVEWPGGAKDLSVASE